MSDASFEILQSALSQSVKNEKGSLADNGSFSPERVTFYTLTILVIPDQGDCVPTNLATSIPHFLWVIVGRLEALAWGVDPAQLMIVVTYKILPCRNESNREVKGCWETQHIKLMHNLTYICEYMWGIWMPFHQGLPDTRHKSLAALVMCINVMYTKTSGCILKRYVKGFMQLSWEI